MIILQYLIETPLYKYFNVSIHHQWASLFALHMNSEPQIPTYNNVHIIIVILTMKKYCTLTNSMIHKFLNNPKIINYENIIYSIACN